MKHGHWVGGRPSKTWTAWNQMIQRCTNPKRRGFGNYGGRGITVCDAWASSFLAFLRDMGLPPTPEHTLDRVDNEKGYGPRNCRWATRQQQARNRRLRKDAIPNNVRAIILTSPKSGRVLAKELGIHHNTVWRIRSARKVGG